MDLKKLRELAESIRAQTVWEASPGIVVKLMDCSDGILYLLDSLKMQAAAATMGMDAAKRTSTIQLQLADEARAETSPDVLASERAANAILTDENESLRAVLQELDALRKDAARYRWLIESEDNADELHAALMNHGGDKQGVDAQIDEEMELVPYPLLMARAKAAFDGGGA